MSPFKFYPIRNLGVMFDTGMTMPAQVASVLKSVNYHLVNIGKPRRLLTHNVQRTSARLQERKFDSITAELINELHWLPIMPIKQRIDYKILALVYKALHGQAPSDAADVLQITTRIGSLDHHARMVLLLSSRLGLGVLPSVTEPFPPMHLDCGIASLVTSKIALSNSLKTLQKPPFHLTSSRY